MKMHRNKKGFELSINTLVVVILGIAVMGMGILSFDKFFRGGFVAYLAVGANLTHQPLRNHS